MLAPYINDLLTPDNVTEEVLDFLEIKGHFREDLLANSKHLSTKLDNYASDRDSVSRAASVVQGYYNPEISYMEPENKSFIETEAAAVSMTYFEVKAISWYDRKDFISYEFYISGQGQEITVEKRYKDFYRLHDKIKKALTP